MFVIWIQFMNIVLLEPQSYVSISGYQVVVVVWELSPSKVHHYEISELARLNNNLGGTESFLNNYFREKSIRRFLMENHRQNEY